VWAVPPSIDFSPTFQVSHETPMYLVLIRYTRFSFFPPAMTTHVDPCLQICYFNLLL
jgi:hypothetical protein